MLDLMSSPPVPVDLEPEDLAPVDENDTVNLAPATARLAGGGFVTTWTYFDVATEAAYIRMQAFDSYGCQIGDTIEVANGLLSSITELSDGRLVVAYSGVVPDHALDVYYQIYDSGLAPVGSPVMVNSLTDGEQKYPSVTALADGGFVVTWTHYAGTLPFGVYVQQFDGDGDPVGAAGRVGDAANGSQVPQVITLDDGSYYVAWQVYEHNEVFGLKGQHFAADGSKIGSVIDMIQGLDAFELGFITESNSVTACAVSGGGYALAWNTDNGDSGHDIFYQIFDPDGSANSSVVQVTDAEGSQYSPVIAQLDDYSMVVAWADAPMGLGQVVHVQRFAADGTPLEANEIAVDTAIAVLGLTVTADDNGGFVVNISSVAFGGIIEGMTFDLSYEAFAPDTPVAMVGTSGDDTFSVHHAGDTITERWNQGTDTVHTNLDSYTLGANLENLNYGGHGNFTGYGNNLANTLTGGSHDDQLDGKRGADTMIGGQGDDTYFVDNEDDQVVEAEDEGTDTVYVTTSAQISYYLSENVENLIYRGSGTIDTYGNALDNSLVGGAGEDTMGGGDGNDILNGRGGGDMMEGGRGDDTYYVDSLGDQVSERRNEGTDVVRSGVDYTLGRYLENLILTGTATNGFGNTLDNRITGNSGDNMLAGAEGNDVLNGGAGADFMTGGSGDDKYYVDNSSDLIAEDDGAGNDLVRASVSYTLSSHIETLILTGTGNIDGTGNGQANTIYGNSGDNHLNGGLGNDTISAGAGADVLDGGGGDDVMTGGLGNDSYYIDSVADRAREYSGGGTDTVYSSVTLTLYPELENLTLTGTGNINGKGNLLDNTLTGNSGDNRLTGGLGADLFVFQSDNGHDTITDFRAGQNDQIVIDGEVPGVITQVGHDAVITLAGGNTITVLNTSATDADFLSHISYLA